MAVPSRPVSGAPIETAWGDVVHDSIVALDVQSGTVAVAFANSPASTVVTVTFPRPFAAGSTPVVLVSGLEATTGANINAGLRSITATQFQVQAREVRETAVTATLTAQWLAIGPRA